MKVCKNCGCPPPKRGEIGEWCSACGAGIDYVEREEKKLKVTLLNTSIITAHGTYRYQFLTLDSARTLALTHAAESAIGHQVTADLLSQLFGFQVAMNRVQYEQQAGDMAIVFKLRGRPEEGKILTREEVDAIGYDFGLLTRTG